MVHGAVRSFFQLLGALVVGLLVVAPLFAWRLSGGPVALDFLTPYIEEALSAADGSFAVRLDTTELAWAGWDRTLDLRAKGVKAVSGEQVIASVPEASLTLSGRALLKGVLAPSSIELIGPHIRLVRDESGVVRWGFGGQGDEASSGELMQRLFADLTEQPNGVAGHLQRVDVVNADMILEDHGLGVVWQAKYADIQLRRDPEGIAVGMQVALDIEGDEGRFDIAGRYRAADAVTEVQTRFTGIRPSVLARFGRPMNHLAAFDVPLAGTVEAAVASSGLLEWLHFDISGKAGVLHAPEPVSADYDVSSLALRGSLTNGFSRLQMDELHVDFGGPSVTVSAVADGVGSASATVKADAVVRDMPGSALPKFWPASVAPDPRRWVTSNITGGVIREARMTVSATLPDGVLADAVIDSLTGEITPEGMLVDYLAPMPPVRDAAAVITFDREKMTVHVTAGEIYGLKLEDGTVVLTGLDKVTQFADIELQIAGPLPDALTLIDQKPLGYAAALGIMPTKVQGDQKTTLTLKFPLLKDLHLDQVSVKAHASATGVNIPGVLMDLDLNGGDVELNMDAKGMDVSGQVVLGTIPAQLQWRENFGKAAFRSRYQLSGELDDEQRRSLGLDFPPFQPPFMRGRVGAAVEAVMSSGGKGEISALIDLAPSEMTLPKMGWSKAAGQPGKGFVSLRLAQNRMAAIPRFEVTAGDLNTVGSVAFANDGTPRRVDFQRLVYGRTNVQGGISFRPGGALDVAFRGPSFDAAAMLRGDPRPEGAAPTEKKADDDLPPMTATIDVGSLWVSKAGRLTGASVALHRSGRDWRSMRIDGTVGADRFFHAQVMPEGSNRSVSITSDDAGAVFQAFEIYENMVGGKLSITGVIDDANPAQPLVGTATVTDYQVVRAPMLARLLTVAALTGILDVLRGEGISFNVLDAPFTLTDGLLEVRSFRAYGPSIGITANGQVDLDSDVVALEGTIVPAYALNAILGNIPLIGSLLTGEKGSGIFAATYNMKGRAEDPTIIVNPLAALTPGFLRNLFEIFDSGSEKTARPAPKPPDAAREPLPQ